jgi:predicted Zn-dependent protease
MAIARQRNAEFDEAQVLLSELLEKEPYRLAYQLQMASLNVQRGRDEQAIETLRDLYLSFPGNQAIAMEYGKALLNQSQSENAKIAIDVLKQQLVSRKTDPSLYALYARAASIAGDEIRATEAIAESYYHRGGTSEAITQLEGLERRSDLDYYQRARVSARLIEIRIEAGEIDDPPDKESFLP